MTLLTIVPAPLSKPGHPRPLLSLQSLLLSSLLSPALVLLGPLCTGRQAEAQEEALSKLAAGPRRAEAPPCLALVHPSRCLPALGFSKGALSWKCYSYPHPVLIHLPCGPPESHCSTPPGDLCLLKQAPCHHPQSGGGRAARGPQYCAHHTSCVCRWLLPGDQGSCSPHASLPVLGRRSHSPHPARTAPRHKKTDKEALKQQNACFISGFVAHRNPAWLLRPASCSHARRSRLRWWRSERNSPHRVSAQGPQGDRRAQLKKDGRQSHPEERSQLPLLGAAGSQCVP